MPTPELVGILNIDKPVGWTSHDVVARVRRLAGQRRVGHAGTLDPLASGVLPVLLGRATRLADFIQAGRKTYIADVRLGIATDTDDAEGSVISIQESVIPADIEPVLTRFRGEVLQTPPQYSAVKVAGQRAYAVARRGGELDLQPRPITIHSLDVLEIAPDTLTLEVACSKGTYIRALARDIAQALGTVGHLTRLVRTRVGPFRLADSVSLDALADWGSLDALADSGSLDALAAGVHQSPTAAGVQHALLPPDVALADLPEYRANPAEAQRLLQGQALPIDGLHANPVRVYDPTGRLMCIATADGNLLRSRFLL
jgi:tRNA pseudouridine55 synthase